MRSYVAPAEVREGDVIDRKYRVEKVLGAGGMGVVVQATHLVLKDRVALKFLRSPLLADEQTVSRFVREAQAAARIKSQHVARVIDIGTLESGSPYMVMEFLEGEDLGSMLGRGEPLALDLVLTWALQACEALASAHAAGVIHRDVKPSNLFIAKAPDGSQVLKVLDFGISKFADPGLLHGSLTESQRSMGTPYYMSPEQMRSAKAVDFRADIWSLGVVLYEALTGELPFIAENLPELCAVLLDATTKPTPMRSARPELPESVERAVLHCLEKDRESRFQTAAELAAELAPFAGDGGLAMAARIARIASGDPFRSGAPVIVERGKMRVGERKQIAVGVETELDVVPSTTQPGPPPDMPSSEPRSNGAAGIAAGGPGSIEAPNTSTAFGQTGNRLDRGARHRRSKAMYALSAGGALAVGAASWFFVPRAATSPVAADVRASDALHGASGAAAAALPPPGRLAPPETQAAPSAVAATPPGSVATTTAAVPAASAAEAARAPGRSPGNAARPVDRTGASRKSAGTGSSPAAAGTAVPPPEGASSARPANDAPAAPVDDSILLHRR